MKRVYYYRSNGLEMRGVVYETASIVIIANKGVSGEIIPRSSLDNGEKYFTTPQRAIESYVALAEAEIADPDTSEQDLECWRESVADAHACLKAALPAARSVGEVQPAPGSEASSSMGLDAIRQGMRAWSGRVGVNNRLIGLLNEYLEGAFLSGYMQALIDNGLPTDDLERQIEERAV